MEGVNLIRGHLPFRKYNDAETPHLPLQAAIVGILPDEAGWDRAYSASLFTS
jgi:hypothetical protein